MSNFNLNTTGMNDYYSNCRISKPILQTDAKTLSFNGFAWSNRMGMIHDTAPVTNEGWQQWLGTQQ